MSEIKIIKGEDFRRLQLHELDVLVELDKVCRENDVRYQIWAGTLLGAVRHKGFIPWDDDIDVVMLREDYEKFRKIAYKLNPDICFFQDHYNDPNYLWEYAKVRKQGTKYIRVNQEHIKCKTGVSIDVFPLDDVPSSLIGQMLQDFHCFILRKTLYARVAIKTEKGLNKVIFELLNKIPVDFVYKRIERYANKSKNDSTNKVRVLLFTSMGKFYYKHPLREKYGMPKKWYLESNSYEFEGHEFYGTKYYDECLKYIYDDYMTLPPEDKREQHSPVSEYEF